MPASGIKPPDANVWLAIAVDGHAHHTTAENWFNAQLEQTCALCRVTQMALLRHLTNSKIMGENVQSQVEAWRAYDVLLQDFRLILLSAPPALEAGFRNFSEADSPSQERWTDAYLAAFAVGIPAQLVTIDERFSRFVGLDLHWLA